MNFKTIKNYAMVALATMALASCANDDFMDDTPSLKAEGMATAPEGILPGVQSANGPWVVTSMTTFFEGFYKSQGNNLSSSIALNQGEKQRYAPGGRAFNGNYYTLNYTKNPSSNLGKRGIRKFSANGGNLTEVGFIQMGEVTFRDQDDEVNFTLFDATTGYYTDGQNLAEGFIGIFNPSTMQTTGNFNVKAGVIGELGGTYTSANVRRIGTKLLIRRGNYLYADVTFGADRNRLKQIRQSTNNVYVAVINVNTHNVEKVLIGYNAENIGLFNDHPLVCIDPVSKDIYFATVGDMDKEYGGDDAGKFSKIFRIDGNNNIDNTNSISYKDVANDPTLTTVTPPNGGSKEGQFNTLYVYGGKIYTKIADRSVVYGDINFHGQTYRNNIWQYVVMNGNSTPQKINIPKDNFYAYQQPQLINGYLYMISNSNQGANVYRVNLGGGNPTVVTTGTPGGWGLGLLNPNKIGSIVKL